VLVVSVPHSDSNENTLFPAGGSVHHAHVNWHVAQILGDCTFWTSDSNISGSNGDLDCTKLVKIRSVLTSRGHLDLIFFKDDSHVAYIFFY